MRLSEEDEEELKRERKMKERKNLLNMTTRTNTDVIALLRDGFGVDVRTKRELEENNKKNRSFLVEKRFFARTLCRARLCEKRRWFLVSSMVLMKERRTTEWFSSSLEEKRDGERVGWRA